MIEMQNGCNCCTIQSDLVEQLIGLAQMKNEDEKIKFNYILIEALGVSEPHEIARNDWDAERRVLILRNKKLMRKRRKSLKRREILWKVLRGNVFIWNAPPHVSSYFRVNSQF